MARKKTPTLSQRLDAASAELVSSLDLFETAAQRLDAAQAVNEGIAAEAREEAARLIAVADEALAQAERASRAAEKVRDLIA